MFNAQNKFRYISQIIESVNKNDDVHYYLPNVYETIVMSKHFDDYAACLTACNTFLKDQVEEINETSKAKHIIVWNENPKYSKNKDTEGPDPWEDDEIMRFYVIKLSDSKKKSISAGVKTTIYVEDVNDQKGVGSRLTH